MLRQIQPICTGNRKTCKFQFAGNRGGEPVAAANQDQDITAPYRPLAAGQFLSIADPAGNRCGDALRQRDCRIIRLGRIDRRNPRTCFRCSLLADQRPDLHFAGIASAQRFMHRAFFRAAQTARSVGIPENLIDGVEDVGRRAEGKLQADIAEDLAGVTGALLQRMQLRGKLFGIGPLEGIDRLLFIADGKDRAVSPIAALAGEEFRDQCIDDFPLPGAGVLRLVDQHVIDAAIELVLDPVADLGAGQQIGRRHDQIVEIHQSAASLEPVIALQNGAADSKQCARSAQHAKGIEPLSCLRDEFRFFAKQFLEPGVQLHNRLGQQRFSRASFFRQQECASNPKRFDRVAGMRQRMQPLGKAQIGGAAYALDIGQGITL